MGAIGGLAYSLSGLANKEKRESFDWTKMAPTVIVAGVVGGVAGFMQLDMAAAQSMGFAAGVTVVVEKLWKALLKQF